MSRTVRISHSSLACAGLTLMMGCINTELLVSPSTGSGTDDPPGTTAPPQDTRPRNEEIDDEDPTPPPPDDGTLPTPIPVPVPPQAKVALSGRVIDLESYLVSIGTSTLSNAGELGVGTASVSTVGLAPELTTVTSSAPGGRFALELPQNGRLMIKATKSSYIPTYNDLLVADRDIRDVRTFAASIAYITGIARAYGIDLTTPSPCQSPLHGGQTCLNTTVVGRVVNDGGLTGSPDPVGGVSALDVTVTTGAMHRPLLQGARVYFLDVDGRPLADPTKSVVLADATTGILRGGYFVAFIEIPQNISSIDTQFSITTLDGARTRYFGPAQTKTFQPGSVSWLVVSETGVPPPTVPPILDFDSQIYPLFLPLAQGGFGCQGCHTNAGGAIPSGGLNLLGIQTAYESLSPAQHPLRVDVLNPDQSLLLRRPVYEDIGAQDHPIYAFTSESDLGYQTILAWIRDGAPRTNGVPRVSFLGEIVPLLSNTFAQGGGAGCFLCHGVAENPPGGFSTLGTAAELYAELTLEPSVTGARSGQPYRISKVGGEAARSLILAKPLLGNLDYHPVRIWTGTTDPRWLLIYRWVEQGYQNN